MPSVIALDVVKTVCVHFYVPQYLASDDSRDCWNFLCCIVYTVVDSFRTTAVNLLERLFEMTYYVLCHSSRTLNLHSHSLTAHSL